MQTKYPKMAKKNFKKTTIKGSGITATQKEGSSNILPFAKKNYHLLIIGLVFIFAGFLLMTGGGSDDPNVFNEGIFNFRRLTLAPVLIIIGYIIEIFAIMKKY